MMQILDCTLRDGGYLNEWDFGEGNIRYLVQRHIMAGTDLIEVGFLNDRNDRKFDKNFTIQPDTSCYDKLLAGVDKKQALLFGMIDYGTCDIENVLPRKEDTMLDGIRIIFKKPNKEKAIAFARQIQQRGYLVTLQLVSVTAYADRDILDFCDEVNEIEPFAVGIVDTYGLMHQEQLMHYFDLLNHNLKPSIMLGYHAHNNFQLAYSNVLRFLESRTTRNIQVDGTAHGMGKNAGNAPLELIMMHMNECYGKHYVVDQVLETIDAVILPIYAKVEWGYKLRFFLSASQACHPNYVTYLLSKKSLSISTVNEILSSIPKEKKLDYNKDLIEELYTKAQTERRCTSYQDEEVARLLEGKNVLMLGPGKSLTSCQDEILKFIDEKKPIVVSINCLPRAYKPDAIFISNSKRYSMLHATLEKTDTLKTIITSNVGVLGDEPDYTLDVARYWEGDSLCGDNALALLLNIMKQDKPEALYLAGFDGFSANNDENFYDRHLAMADDFTRLLSVNNELKQRIAQARTQLNITFLTKSQYE